MRVNGLHNIEVSDIELNIKERLYAKDAFKMIEENYKNTEIFFIMGADNFINITKWKDTTVLLEKYKYIVLGRANIDINKYINENDILIKYKDKIQIITNDSYIGYNSTEFRNKIKEENKYNQEIVADKVIDYIIENELYK